MENGTQDKISVLELHRLTGQSRSEHVLDSRAYDLHEADEADCMCHNVAASLYLKCPCTVK